MGQCFARDEFFYNRIGDSSSGHVSPKRTDLDPSAADVGSNNLICERDANRVEVYVLRNCIDLAASMARVTTNRSYTGQTRYPIQARLRTATVTTAFHMNY